MDGNTFSNTLLNKKISKLLESDLDTDKETLEAVKGLSLFFNENTINARRNLRNTLEKRSLVFNEQFLSSFGEAKKLMDSLHSDLTAMNQCCQQTMNKLKVLKTRNHHLLQKTNQLKDERKLADKYQLIVDKFLKKFHLEPDEIAILKGSSLREDHHEVPMTETFFELLQKCRRIHEDSKMLLKTNQQTTGIEIMDAMSVLEEAAFERLYKWTLNILRSYNSDSNEMSHLLYQALMFIEERPVLFKHCMDEYGTVRRSAIVRNLIDALTRGGPAGNPPPMDLHSNDPVRYVGDIMAWVHQAIASEKELLQLLLQRCNQEVLGKNNTIQVSLSFITDSLFRPIKARVEQILISEPSSNKSHGPLVLFKVKNLVKFYQKVFAEELLPDSQLVYTMAELDSLAHRVFINSLNFHCAYKLGKSMDGDYEEPPPDLSPTESFVKTVYLLEQILSFQDSSILSPVDHQEVMITIVNVVVKPLLQACRICASKLPGLEMSIFLLNCFNDVYRIISRCEYIDEFKEILGGQIHDYQESLINENAANIIAYFGLTAVYNSIKNEATLPLSSITGCDPLALQSCSRKIDSFLAKPDSFQLVQLKYLKCPELREAIRRKSLELLCQMYQEIFQAIHKKENEYDEPEHLLTQTPDHFASILM